ncbi:Predicted ATPase [Nonomuraea solani]|uniref:Predicted ATPase n=1 Tax=Nonomuraea solani TaxID=1144553 RepID=A0A1H5VUA9_9ACTN|nr:LuxR C-terminal-related transcriptional regulator [Nonomuraea solani]SEF90147.1 Predicted ATPase [Nonomuraea solani]
MGTDPRTAGVTPRELEVLWLVGDRLQNQEIAARLRLSERTVESHVSSLLRKLGGGNRLALVDVAARVRARREPRDALPRPLSSFVGRTRELGDLHRLLGEHRLVTLTGPAGTGKTRLALRLAHSVTSLPPAVLIDLAPVAPGEAVERAFADALGVIGQEHRLRALIRGTLADGRHWLIVDNCEHVTAGVAALLADLLTGLGDLHVLATGHGALHLDGEVVYEIPPLPLPAELDDPAAVLASGAGRLFADRAAAASPGFEVTAANARQVATICRRLDGLPLAIELAAARVRFFTPTELLARLDDRFALLTDGARGSPSRHRTLEEALAWSYELLSEDERLLLERCSVFPGEFDYDTAEQVVAYPPLRSPDLLGSFARLLDRSLISSHRRDETTEYRLLESVRQFAHRRLAARGGAETAREQHAGYHLRHAVAAVPDLRGRDQVAALRWMYRRSADLSAALRWALDRDDPTAAWEFIAGIGTAWEIVGCSGELFDWLDRLLRRPLPDGALGLRVAITCAIVLCYQDTKRARDFAERACRTAGDGTGPNQARPPGWPGPAATTTNGCTRRSIAPPSTSIWATMRSRGPASAGCCPSSGASATCGARPAACSGSAGPPPSTGTTPPPGVTWAKASAWPSGWVTPASRRWASTCWPNPCTRPAHRNAPPPCSAPPPASSRTARPSSPRCATTSARRPSTPPSSMATGPHRPNYCVRSPRPARSRAHTRSAIWRRAEAGVLARMPDSMPTTRTRSSAVTPARMPLALAGSASTPARILATRSRTAMMRGSGSIGRVVTMSMKAVEAMVCSVIRSSTSSTVVPGSAASASSSATPSSNTAIARLTRSGKCR